MPIPIPRACRALLSVALVVPGCQTYEPHPLDASGHRSAWQARSAESPGVLEFARALSARDPSIPVFDPGDGITCLEAEVIALVFNPELRLVRLRAGVAAATAEHAGLWDDPELSIDVLRITESVSDPWVVTPGIAFTIPLSGRLEVESERAQAALRVARLEAREAEWRVRYELRRAWTDWSAATLRAAETERLLALMHDYVVATARLVEAGEMSSVDAARFAIEQSQRRRDLHRLRGAVDAGEQRVRMLMGLSPVAPIDLRPAVEITVVDHAGGGEAARERSLTLQRLREAYAVAEQTLHREVRKQYPDLVLGPLYESDQGQSRVGFFGAIPLPFLNANRQGIAEARAQREYARAAFEAACERLEGELALAQARAVALAAQRIELVDVVGPLVDRQVIDARRLFDLGEGPARDVIESIVSAHETKLSVLDAWRDEAGVAARLAYLVGPEPPRNHSPIDESDPSADPAEVSS